QAQKERSEGVVAQIGPKEKATDVHAGPGDPRRAEQNRQQVYLRQVQTSQSERHGAEPRGEWPKLHRSQKRVHAEQADVDVHEDEESIAEVVAGKKNEPG